MDSKMISPLDTLQWVDRGRVKPNDYNPNKVSKQNLELLKQSILTNGWTLPIVVRPDFTIIDGSPLDCCRRRTVGINAGRKGAGCHCRA